VHALARKQGPGSHNEGLWVHPESGPIMLTLSFVEFDPGQTSSTSLYDCYVACDRHAATSPSVRARTSGEARQVATAS
jgi:hypothetical protein